MVAVLEKQNGRGITALVEGRICEVLDVNPYRMGHYAPYVLRLVSQVEHSVNGRNQMTEALRFFSGREGNLGKVIVSLDERRDELWIGNAESAWLAMGIDLGRCRSANGNDGMGEASLVATWRTYRRDPIVLTAVEELIDEGLSNDQVELWIHEVIGEVMRLAAQGELKGGDCCPADRIGGRFGRYFRAER